MGHFTALRVKAISAQSGPTVLAARGLAEIFSAAGRHRAVRRLQYRRLTRAAFAVTAGATRWLERALRRQGAGALCQTIAP